MNISSIPAEDFNIKIFQAIRYDWLLITGGVKGHFNSMTACWGGMGHLWDKHHVCFIFVRPSRFTYEFLEKYDYFSVQFFEDKHKDKLHYLGTNSGRNIDKARQVSFTPAFTSSGSIYYKEAKLVLDCKKIYFQDIEPQNFLDDSIGDWYATNYPEDGYHRMYVGTILNLFEIDQSNEK